MRVSRAGDFSRGAPHEAMPCRTSIGFSPRTPAMLRRSSSAPGPGRRAPTAPGARDRLRPRAADSSPESRLVQSSARAWSARSPAPPPPSTGSTRAWRGWSVVTLTLEAIECELSLGRPRSRPPRLDRLTAVSGRIRTGHSDAATSCWPPAARRRAAAFITAIAALDALPPERQHTRQTRRYVPTPHRRWPTRDPEENPMIQRPDRSFSSSAPLLRLVAAVLAYSTLPASPARAQSPLAARRSVWKYLDTGSDQGTAWRAAGFIDTGLEERRSGTRVRGRRRGHSSWLRPEQHRQAHHDVFPPCLQRCRSARLRRPDAAHASRRRCRGLLNGTRGVPHQHAGRRDQASTFASSVVLDANERTYVTASVNPALLVAGTNVLAVEIHQSDLTSSDISFNLELTVLVVGDAHARALPAIGHAIQHRGAVANERTGRRPRAVRPGRGRQHVGSRGHRGDDGARGDRHGSAAEHGVLLLGRQRHDRARRRRRDAFLPRPRR